MARLLIGAALLPTAAFAALAAARVVAGLTSHGQVAWPFLTGAGLTAIAWWFGRYCLESTETAAWPIRWSAALSRRGYVLGHELTHALAAWAVGAKVHGIHVGEDSGHVDLSHSNAFVALAPYCIPIYTLAVVASYRGLLWLHPSLAAPTPFLAVVGASVAFHLIKTFETLWDASQPDLPAAGGVVFSVACIVLANAACIVLLTKALFPAAVDAAAGAGVVAEKTVTFWKGAWNFVQPMKKSFLTQMGRP